MSRTYEELNLIFDEPVQKKKAPKHLADFAPEDRKNFAKELGFQPFRAAQVATHYFSHLNNDPETWTDIPADQRESIAELLTPKLMELVTTRTTDGGMTRKDLWKLHDGTLVENSVTATRAIFGYGSSSGGYVSLTNLVNEFFLYITIYLYFSQIKIPTLASKGFLFRII